ncbi:MAG: hypothetical protein AAB969_03910 [Patescibacteria group bacterium]
MMTKTKTKTKAYLGITMGVVLVIGSAIFGSMALNAISALSLSTSNNNQWVYLYGPGKATQSDFNNLTNYVKTGADIKVQDGQSVNLCYRVAVLNDDIFCGTLSSNGIQESDGYGEFSSQFLALKSKLGFSINTVDYIRHFSDGKLQTRTDSKDSNFSKWYGRK